VDDGGDQGGLGFLVTSLEENNVSLKIVFFLTFFLQCSDVKLFLLRLHDELLAETCFFE
jgi:hypothetical protein